MASTWFNNTPLEGDMRIDFHDKAIPGEYSQAQAQVQLKNHNFDTRQGLGHSWEPLRKRVSESFIVSSETLDDELANDDGCGMRRTTEEAGRGSETSTGRSQYVV